MELARTTRSSGSFSLVSTYGSWKFGGEMTVESGLMNGIRGVYISVPMIWRVFGRVLVAGPEFMDCMMNKTFGSWRDLRGSGSKFEQQNSSFNYLNGISWFDDILWIFTLLSSVYFCASVTNFIVGLRLLPKPNCLTLWVQRLAFCDIWPTVAVSYETIREVEHSWVRVVTGNTISCCDEDTASSKPMRCEMEILFDVSPRRARGRRLSKVPGLVAMLEFRIICEVMSPIFGSWSRSCGKSLDVTHACCILPTEGFLRTL